MTNATSELEDLLTCYVDANRDRLIELIRDLVRTPSENTPPVGAEGDCQRYVAKRLAESGWEPKIYRLADVPGLADHALYWAGRDYDGRPNVVATRTGCGGGRSLILSGHVDTVPKGTLPWTRDPFGGSIEGNRLYGRGANDMKAGIATNLFIAEAIQKLDLRLKGDLTIETVVDEEFGGVNGTLAGRLMGYRADAAVIGEPSFLRICAAQRGGRTAHITLSAGHQQGVLHTGAFPGGISSQLRSFLEALERFSQLRRATAGLHPLYAHLSDPVPVSVTKVYTGPWGTKEPMYVPSQCQIELYWQTMPGERVEDIDLQFHQFIESLAMEEPDTFKIKPQVEFPIRWLPGSTIDPAESVVRELSQCAKLILKQVAIAGIEGPCDMYVFHHFGIPTVLWGATGGNTHEADEYVELDSVVAATKALLLFVCRWCGPSGLS